jgi:hypothetical protein
LDAAIILATLVLQLDSHPVSDREMGLSYIPNRGQPAIGELDDLANKKLVRHDAQLTDEASS